MPDVRKLKIPAEKVNIIGLGKDNRWKLGTETSEQYIFIPNDKWMDWALQLQAHPSDEAFFVCCGSQPYRLVYAGNWPSLDAMIADHCNGEVAKQTYDVRPLAMFIVDAETVAYWLAENPIENTHAN